MPNAPRGQESRRSSLPIGLVIGGLAVAVMLLLMVAVGAATMGDAKRGEAHARAVCAECHATAPDDRKVGYADATAFQVLADRKATTELSLRAFLRSPHENMPELILTEGEIDDIAAYILSLR